MRITIIEKDIPENNGGGCNLVIGDFFICLISVTYFLYTQAAYDLLPSIFFGFLAAVLLFFLLNIPYVGFILQIILGAMWGLLIFLIFTIFSIFSSDPSLGLIISIVIGILLHILSFFSLGGNLGFPSRRRKRKMNQNTDYNYIELVNAYNKTHDFNKRLCWDAEKILNQYSGNSLNDFDNIFSLYKNYSESLLESFAAILTLIQESQNMSYLNQARDIVNELDTLQRQFYEQIQIAKQKVTINNKGEHYSYSSNNQQNDENIDHQSNTSDTYTSLFNGCNDLPSLTKRYKDLMKTFHPDNQNGDHDTTIKITDTYHTLKKKYE